MWMRRRYATAGDCRIHARRHAVQAQLGTGDVVGIVESTAIGACIVDAGETVITAAIVRVIVASIS